MRLHILHHFGPGVPGLLRQPPGPRRPARCNWKSPATTNLGAGMSFQQWGQALAAAGVQNFRLRSAQEGDKPAIEVGGTAQMPFYKVTAVLGARDELIVPGGRFRRSECKKLAAWLDDLAKRGPPEKREKVSAFGLTASQLQKVNADLAKAVGFSTKGMTRSEAVNKIAGQLGLSLKIEGALTDGDDKIEEELSDFSSGTALACILRPIGFCMVPRESRRDAFLRGEEGPARSGDLAGRLARRGAQKVLPALYEFHNVNVSGVTATKLLEVVSKQIKAPGALRSQRPGPARHRARQGDRFASPAADDLQRRAAEDAGEGRAEVRGAGR